jgi:hypothetical protein
VLHKESGKEGEGQGRVGMWTFFFMGYNFILGVVGFRPNLAQFFENTSVAPW